MDRLRERLTRLSRYDTLDYKHAVREYLAQHPRDSMPPELLDMATSCFKYYKQYKSVFDRDLSLKAVTATCNTDNLMLDVEAEDPNVTRLAKYFNNMMRSSRELFKCYDCGTNARAVFLNLIMAHRGGLIVHEQEKKRLDDMYRPDDIDPSGTIDKFVRFAQAAKTDTLFICSLGLGRAGHVWVVEKRFINGRPRYHHYQSCLYSHLVLDYVERCDYGRNPNQSLDIVDFYDRVKVIMEHRQDWNEAIKHQFAELFAYLPNNPVVKPNTSFCWGYVTYKEAPQGGVPRPLQMGGGGRGKSKQRAFMVSVNVTLPKGMFKELRGNSQVELVGSGFMLKSGYGTDLDYESNSPAKITQFIEGMAKRYPKRLTVNMIHAPVRVDQELVCHRVPAPKGVRKFAT